MSETVATVRSLIEARLKELEEEAERLEQALKQLTENRPAAVASKGGRPRRRAPRKRRAGRGQRRAQFLEAVKRAPGAKASEIAKEIGISANQAYTLARQLVQNGEIKKSGKGYRARSNPSG